MSCPPLCRVSFGSWVWPEFAEPCWRAGFTTWRLVVYYSTITIVSAGWEGTDGDQFPYGPGDQCAGLRAVGAPGARSAAAGAVAAGCPAADGAGGGDLVHGKRGHGAQGIP